MADFCHQCSIETFGKDFGELAGLSKPEDTERKLYAQALCEGCGFILVDHTGKCMSPGCFENHNEEC